MLVMLGMLACSANDKKGSDPIFSQADDGAKTVAETGSERKGEKGSEPFYGPSLFSASP